MLSNGQYEDVSFLPVYVKMYTPLHSTPLHHIGTEDCTLTFTPAQSGPGNAPLTHGAGEGWALGGGAALGCLLIQLLF